MEKREYKSYKSYKENQMDGVRRFGKKAEKFNHKDNYKQNKKYYDAWFNMVEEEFLLKDKKSLCLGARAGTEVKFLRERGSEAIGIDFMPIPDPAWEPPLVIEGDMHNLSFNDEEFDFVYSNAIDHIQDLDKVLSEISRVLKIGGCVFLNIFPYKTNLVEFESFSLDSPNEIIERLPNFKVIKSEAGMSRGGLKWCLFMMKESN